MQSWLQSCQAFKPIGKMTLAASLLELGLTQNYRLSVKRTSRLTPPSPFAPFTKLQDGHYVAGADDGFL